MIEIQITRWPFIQWRGEAIRPRALAWIFLWISIFAGSTYNAFAKELTSALSPLSLVLISEIVTALFIAFSFGFVPITKKIRHLPHKNAVPLLSVALFSGVLGPALWFMGLFRTSAINATLFSNAEMVFLIILAVIVLKERWTYAHIAAGATITAGMAFIALRGFTEGISVGQGDAFFILSCLSFSSASIVFCKYLHKMDPNIVIFTRSVLTVCLLFIILGITGNPLAPDLLTFPMGLIPVLLGFALISRFLNAFSYYESLEKLPISTVSIVSNMHQVTSIAFSALYLSEAIHWYQVVGGLVIIAGILILELQTKYSKKFHWKVHHIRQRHLHR